VIPRFKGGPWSKDFFPHEWDAFLAVSSRLCSFSFLFLSPQSRKSLDFTVYSKCTLSYFINLTAETPIRLKLVGNLSVMPPQPLMVLSKGHRQIYLEPSKLKTDRLVADVTWVDSEYYFLGMMPTNPWEKSADTGIEYWWVGDSFFFRRAFCRKSQGKSFHCFR